MNRLNQLPNDIINDIYKIVFKECLLELEARKCKFRLNVELKEVNDMYDDSEDELIYDVHERNGDILARAIRDFNPPYWCYQGGRLLTKGA